MAIIPKVYLNSVVSIGVRDNANKIHWIGTGFFVARDSDTEGQVPLPLFFETIKS